MARRRLKRLHRVKESTTDIQDNRTRALEAGASVPYIRKRAARYVSMSLREPGILWIYRRRRGQSLLAAATTGCFDAFWQD